MAGDQYTDPSTKALSLLAERINADCGLPEQFKVAVLADLAGPLPAQLEALKAIVNQQADADEVDNADSA